MKEKITKLYATRGDMRGEIDLQWEPAPGSGYYILEMCRVRKPNLRWKMIDILTRSIYKVSGLRSNTCYRFRVARVNSNEPGKWSNEISISAP